jgi:hypothetical protein
MGVPTKWKGGDGKHFHYKAQENDESEEEVSASSFDLAQFGLGLELDSEGSDLSQSDDRDARLKAAQAGIQASLSTRASYVDGDDGIEEVGERRRGRSRLLLNHMANAQADGATLAKDMTENSVLFKSQKERTEETTNPAQLTFDGNVSFTVDVSDAEEDVEKEQPEPTPAPKPLKPNKCTYRNMCFVSLVLLILAGAIVGSVGVTQDWFGDSSSSKKSNEEEPTFRPSTGPTTRNSSLRPTTSPTTSGPTLGPTLGPNAEPTVSPLQPPTTRPATSVPSAPPSAFVEPEEFMNLVAAASFDGGTSAQSEGTPQSKAVKWVASRTIFDTLTAQQKIQRYALAAFYYSTNGDNWTNNDGWLSEESECNWYTRSFGGDVCDSNGVFTDLELGFNNLGGVIPPEIGLLTSLTVISLGAGLRGNMQGTLPPQLGRLSLMETFNVRDNDITGVIPPELGAWTSLEVFDLSRNQLSGPIPSTIGQMTALTRLDFARNELTGQVPNRLAALNLLENVRLEENNLTGAIPSDVCAAFSGTSPLFYADCGVPPGVLDSEIGCSCCSYCCSDEQGCFSA